VSRGRDDGRHRHRHVWKLAGAVALGAGLASLPFLQYGLGHGHAHSIVAHTDHSAHHGGRLTMVGDHHIEVVRSADEIRIFVSDGLRRPLEPASGVVRFASGDELQLRWRSSHLVAAHRADGGRADLTIELEDGTVLELPEIQF
jgi:hypothetical protein